MLLSLGSSQVYINFGERLGTLYIQDSHVMFFLTAKRFRPKPRVASTLGTTANEISTRNGLRQQEIIER